MAVAGFAASPLDCIAHEHGGVDLRFATMMNDLGLPQRNAHDALNDAVMAGLAFVKLRHLLRGR